MISDATRNVVSPANFTSPTTYFECVGSDTTSGLTTWLSDHSTNESGTAGLAQVASSSITFGSTKARVRTGNLSVISGDRFLTQILGTGSSTITSCQAIIKLN